MSAAVLLVVALFNLDHLVLVEVLLVAGYFFANLYQSALGGWLASITTTAEENRLSVWVTIGNLGGGGAMAVATGELIRNLSTGMSALMLGAVVLLPTAVFPWMPAPGPHRRPVGGELSTFVQRVGRPGEAARGADCHCAFHSACGDIFIDQLPQRNR